MRCARYPPRRNARGEIKLLRDLFMGADDPKVCIPGEMPKAPASQCHPGRGNIRLPASPFRNDAVTRWSICLHTGSLANRQRVPTVWGGAIRPTIAGAADVWRRVMRASRMTEGAPARLVRSLAAAGGGAVDYQNGTRAGVMSRSCPWLDNARWLFAHSSFWAGAPFRRALKVAPAAPAMEARVMLATPPVLGAQATDHRSVSPTTTPRRRVRFASPGSV